MKYLQDLISFLMTRWTHFGGDKLLELFYLVFTLSKLIIAKYLNVKYHTVFAVLDRFKNFLLFHHS